MYVLINTLYACTLTHTHVYARSLTHTHTHTERERDIYIHTHTHTHKQIKRQEQSVINFEQEGKRFIVVTNKLLNEEAELSPRVFVGGCNSVCPLYSSTIAYHHCFEIYMGL